MPTSIPCMWCDSYAEEAVHFYISLFKNSKVLDVSRYGEGGPGPAGQVFVMSFELDGHEYKALNGGPVFKFTEAISFFVNCETQDEVDDLWEKLSAGGEKGRCGWLKDKFGMSWQVVPTSLGEVMSDPDPVKAQRVVQALMQMSKIDLKALENARDA